VRIIAHRSDCNDTIALDVVRDKLDQVSVKPYRAEEDQISMCL
jgi:hypothetical protein